MKIDVKINEQPLILIDGLTLDDIKAKYSWLMNAKFENAVIGEANNKIIWYMGDWIDGEWFDGIWYSGNFYNGIWRTGQWYSKKYDRHYLLGGQKILLEESDDVSYFHKGIWKDGVFNSGFFGEDIDLNWSNSGDSKTVWENGVFNNGIIRNSLWLNGELKYCLWLNSWWKNGKWFNGKFNKGIWEDGLFNGGDFIEGTWKNGIFDQPNSNNASRFGVYTENLNIDDPICIWENGTFKKGEFYSGLFLDENKNPIPSENNKISIWKDGIWESGYWFGGQFERGTWNNGFWFGGVWGTWSTDWVYPKYIEQKKVNVFSGTTESIKEIEIINISGYTDYYNFYDANPSGTRDILEFSGTTYDDQNNKVDSFNDIPPYYYYTNYENFETGLTNFILDSGFTIDINSGSPWDISNIDPSGATGQTISGSYYYNSNSNVSATGFTILEQGDLLIPKDLKVRIGLDLSGWSSSGGTIDPDDYFSIKLYGKYGNVEEIDVLDSSGNKLTFDDYPSSSGLGYIETSLFEDIEKIELIYNASGSGYDVQIELDSVELVFEQNGDFALNKNLSTISAYYEFSSSGNIYMEGKSQKFSNKPGDVHEVYINVIEMDNVDLTLRLLDESGNTSYAWDEESTIMKDYFNISKTGASNYIFFEDTDFNEVFLDFTSERQQFNEPFNLKVQFFVKTYSISRLNTNLSGERLYNGDNIKFTTRLDYNNNNINNFDATNNIKYYLTDKNNNIISDTKIHNLTTLSSSTNYEIQLECNTTSEDYKLNLELYRIDTNFYYSKYDSEIEILSQRIIDEVEWIDTDNLLDSDDSTYSYYRDNTGRNDVNVLILSGFSFNVPNETDIDLKGFKLRVIRSGFYQNDNFGSVKDLVFSVDYQPFRNQIFLAGNKPNPKSFSSPTNFKIETIDYGGYEEFFGFEDFNWSIDKVNNQFKLIYQPVSSKSIRLSDALNIEGRLYDIKAKTYYQTKPTWNNGTWYNGLWINGYFYNGNFINGTFLNGLMRGKLNI